MLKYYIRHSGLEPFREVAAPPKEGVWIQGEAVTEVDLRHLAQEYGMDFNILRDVLDKDELPRVEMKDKGLYAFVRSVQSGKHGSVTTTPVLLVAKGTVFMSLSAVPVPGHATVSSHVAAHFVDTESLLLGTFASIIGEYEAPMQKTARHIRDTGQRLRTHEITNEDFVKFVTVEDNLNEYLMNLNSMLVVAERLKELFQDTNDNEAVEDIILYIRQLVVAIDSHNQSIVSIRNAYGTIANNTLNQRMKTLTVLTVLIALPNVVYGMYGMNLTLPFQDEPWAYGAVLIVSLVFVMTMFIVARRKGVF